MYYYLQFKNKTLESSVINAQKLVEKKIISKHGVFFKCLINISVFVFKTEVKYNY